MFLAAPPVGTTVCDACSSGDVYPQGSQPVPVHISSFDPTWGQVGQSVPVSINGSGFGTAPTVVFQTGSGITSSYSTRSDGFIGVVFTIPPNEPVGFETFTVKNNTRTDGSPNSNPVSFQVTPAVATPVNFHIVSESPLNDGSLFFTYTWSSSTGNRADLYQCRLGEQVFYPNYPVSPFIWPLPMVQSSINPSVPTLGQGTDMLATDQNYPPGSYQKPYRQDGFPATQRWFWACSNYNNSAIQALAPDVIIKRSTFMNTDGFWYYQITKSGYTNTFKLPNQ